MRMSHIDQPLHADRTLLSARTSPSTRNIARGSWGDVTQIDYSTVNGVTSYATTTTAGWVGTN